MLSVEYVTELILSTATGMFNKKEIDFLDLKKSPLDVYRESILNVVSTSEIPKPQPLLTKKSAMRRQSYLIDSESLSSQTNRRDPEPSLYLVQTALWAKPPAMQNGITRTAQVVEAQYAGAEDATV